MKFAKKIIFLVRDNDGFGPAIALSLIPNPNSDLTKSESKFELSLTNYGITDQKASGDLINFVDSQGEPQVSILLLPNYEPPIAACAVREVLSSILSDNLSGQPTIVLPFVMKSLKFNQDIEIEARTDFAQAMLSEVTKTSSPVQLNCEPSACLLHMVRVLRLPTVLLIASDGQSQNKRAIEYELEALCKIGQFLAGHLCLSFSKEGLQHKEAEKSTRAQEPWRALYL
ncbi:uncharacterized protein A4U43_C01F5260 [Asparagus officinalis]|uniref:DUF7894 domain-containing protein n=1 Tax=Asparagus officinalis TaxID=4686 RepID=A0A5P1FQQ8_ASPOF|nr:uncharacterized protein LOC109848937 [Asparagus officinalis]XP_020274269.1 uncharacterized protein LOC109848937 [Asparagus officinalis]ONK79329.1 uncharacterized protein A4U43_C01F5260 [Asparagus officinalis]